MKPLADQVNGRMRLALWVLAGAVGVVMLIVCANLSNLLLARTASRQKEIAIRTALGAGRGRLIAQMLTEGIVLSCSGAVARPGDRDRRHARARAASTRSACRCWRSVRVDAAALGFTLAIALAHRHRLRPGAGASTRRNRALHDALKDASRGSTGRPAPGCATRWSSPRSPSPACCWSAPACCLRSFVRRARRRSRVPSVARRSRCASIPTAAYDTREQATGLPRRSAAPRRASSGRRERRHHRRAAARAGIARGARAPRA